MMAYAAQFIVYNVMVCVTQVRASNLQELVYKLGQAGVTKATVTITFDNTDKEQSPLGYRDYDQITITRQVILRYMLHKCLLILLDCVSWW